MLFKSLLKKLGPFVFLFLISIALTTAVKAQADKETPESQRKAALELAGKNLYIEAFPILEAVAPKFPEDAELWAHYGIAILTRSGTLSSPEQRKIERIRAYGVLKKAKKLGTQNVVALHFLDKLPPDGGDEDNLVSENPDYEKYMREGENFFGRGEYQKAFVEYEKAYKLNPKGYEAVLFMGDALYGDKKYKESETWFAKAVELNPDREAAYRYWGDALMNQGKPIEARDKFVEAFIVEPFSRLTLDRLNRWIDETKTPVKTFEIEPPGGSGVGEMVIDENLLKAEDGTINWKIYGEMRKAQAAKGGKRTLADEAAIWHSIAESFKKDLKAGKIKYPDQSLTNLVKLDDAGLLEPYILLNRPEDDYADDFFSYRDKNRDKFRRFVIEFLLGMKQ